MHERTLTSTANPRIKEALRLRDRKHRDAAGCMMIDGAREALRAIEAGVRVVEAFVCESLCRSPEAQELRAKLGDGPEVWYTTPAVFERLAYGERGDGVVVVAETPVQTLSNLRLTGTPLVAVLEGVEKPGNIGAALRSADAAGVSAVIVADGGTDLYNPNTIRASLGTIFTVPVCAATSVDTIAWLRSQVLKIYAARVDATAWYTDVPLSGPTAIVLGSEAHGLTRAWHAADIMPIKLPMHGAADSLNVSATATVLFYEALRQRR